jgi:hypothetical protein
MQWNQEDLFEPFVGLQTVSIGDCGEEEKARKGGE